MRYLIVIFFLCSSFLVAQEEFLELQGDGIWKLTLGPLNIERTAIIVSRLYWEGKEIPGSKSDCEVARNTIVATYQPGQKRIPSGKYTWELFLQSEQIRHPFPYKQEFYFGSAGQKQSELKEFAQFYQTILTQIVQLVRKMRRTKENPTVANSELLSVLKRWQETNLSLQNQISNYLQNYWFIPDMESMEDFHGIQYAMEMLLSLHSYRLIPDHDVPWDKDLAKKFSGYSNEHINNQIVHYTSLVEATSKKILARQLLPENLTEKNLEEDLAWLNNIFQDLQNMYERYRPTETEATITWQKEAKGIEQEIQAYQLRAKEYAQTNLAKKYPKLPENMVALGKKMQEILLAYTARIGGKNTIKNIENLTAEMQKIYEELAEVPKLKEAEEEKNKQNQFKQALQDIQTILFYYKEFSENLGNKDITKFLEWETAWSNKVNGLSRSPAWKTRFPKLGRTYHSIVLELLSRSKLESDWRNAKDPATKQIKLAQVKRSEYKLQLLFRELDNDKKDIIASNPTILEEK